LPDDNDTNGAAVPTCRAAQLWHFGGMATGIAGSVAARGLRALAGGKRPDLAQLLLTPANTLRLTDGLSHLRGAALKLGQMLSIDTGIVLPGDLTAILSRMRDDARHMLPKQLQAVLNADWGPGWYSRFARFDVCPFAGASIGQEHRAMLPDGTALAVKVQYPGERDSIDSDVDNVASLLRLPGLLPRGMDMSPLLVEAKRQLHAEADYTAEAQHLARFGNLLAGPDIFALPALHAPLCTPQVLAIRYMDIAPLGSLTDAPQALRDRVAGALIDLVLRELFEFGAMQTDPNLANYRYDPKTGRIVLLDFGAVQPNAHRPCRRFPHAGPRGAGWRGRGHARGHAAHRILRPGHRRTPSDADPVMFTTAMGPVRQDAPFDFCSSTLLERLRDMGVAIGNDLELAHVPPRRHAVLAPQDRRDVSDGRAIARTRGPASDGGTLLPRRLYRISQ